MQADDLKSLAVGVVAWTAVIPAVKAVGSFCANGGTKEKLIAVALGVAVAASTTPILSRLLGWRTREQRVRGIALALGAAQTIDGLTHIFNPTFYSANAGSAISSAGNIFLGAGLLGIASTF